MFEFLYSLVLEVFRRIDYSFATMSETQWAIFASISVGVGFVLVKSKISC